jgi:predicted PurR-regulated permease PerM
MQRAAVLLLLALAVVGVVLWLSVIVLTEVGKGLRPLASKLQNWWRRRTALAAWKAEQKRLEILRKKQEPDTSYRSAHPAKLAGVPDLRLLRKLV